MQVRHLAMRSVAIVAALSLGLSGCSDSTAPDVPFDPSNMSSDLEVINEAFAAPIFQSFDAADDQLYAVSGWVFTADAKKAPATNLRLGAAESAQHLASQLVSRSAVRPSFAGGPIPSTYAGKSFEYNPATGEYAMTNRPGAPANGVRFILYSVDPTTHVPTEPLTEIGYTQLTATQLRSTVTAHLTIASGTTTSFDYTASQGEGTVSAEGFVMNGAERINFSLLSQEYTVRQLFEVPSRGFRLSMSIGYFLSGPVAVELEARGRHGRLNMDGTLGGVNWGGRVIEEGGTMTIRVNSEVFAAITLTESTTTMVGVDGRDSLTEEERETLSQVLDVFDDGLTSFWFFVIPVPQV